MSKHIFVLGILASLTGAGAQANIRGPQNVFRPPSFSLSPLKSQPQSGLVVQSETLDVECDYNACKVHAVYHITAKERADLAFAFILPSRTPVQARVANSFVTSTLTPVENNTLPPVPDAQKYYEPLYQANFEGTLYPGNNTIDVSYLQPLTILEMEYGYFTDSRFLEKFRYQMGPLKEWTLAKDFTMAVKVSTLRKRPERDDWSLVKTRSIDCGGGDKQHIEKEGDRLVLTIHYDQHFPTTFSCWIGDSDFLEDDD